MVGKGLKAPIYLHEYTAAVWEYALSAMDLLAFELIISNIVPNSWFI